jgi:hypothetical protein
MTTRKEQNYGRINAFICSSCGSKLIKTNNTLTCSMDKITFWRQEIELYKQMNTTEQKLYLDSIQDKTKFLTLVQNIDTYDCGFSLNLSNITSSNSLRVPDSIAVKRLERLLKRELTELEREEGFVFKLKDELYQLPFLNFPDES